VNSDDEWVMSIGRVIEAATPTGEVARNQTETFRDVWFPQFLLGFLRREFAVSVTRNRAK